MPSGGAIKGSKHPNAKLSEAVVEHMFKLRAQGYSLQKIADLFEVHHSLVARILNGELWRHVTQAKQLPKPLPTIDLNNVLCPVCQTKMTPISQRIQCKVGEFDYANCRYPFHEDVPGYICEHCETAIAVLIRPQRPQHR